MPPGGGSYKEQEARRQWLASQGGGLAGGGAGPFGIPYVGLPPATNKVVDPSAPATSGSATPSGAGLPYLRFVQQPPGSTSFLDSALDAGVRTVPPNEKVALPPTEPLWRLGPGGGVTPGLRAPFGPVHAPRPFVGWTSSIPEITHFDPQWGEPPMLPGLAWSTERFLYEPDKEAMRFAKGAQWLFDEHSVKMAGYQAYVQAYREDGGTGSWAYRWVRATTPLPTRSAPYEILGPYDKYKLDLEKRPDYGPPTAFATGYGQGLPFRPSDETAMGGGFGGLEAQVDGSAASPRFDISQYEYVGVYHRSGQIDRVVYHLEPRKEFSAERQNELWEILCTAPDVPAEWRPTPEDCALRRGPPGAG
jgi:hypothetical protein